MSETMFTTGIANSFPQLRIGGAVMTPSGVITDLIGNPWPVLPHGVDIYALHDLQNYSFHGLAQFIRNKHLEPGSPLRMGDRLEAFVGWREDQQPLIIFGILKCMTEWLLDTALMHFMGEQKINTGGKFYAMPDEEAGKLINQNQKAGVLECMLSRMAFPNGHRRFWLSQTAFDGWLVKAQDLNHTLVDPAYSKDRLLALCPVRSPEP